MMVWFGGAMILFTGDLRKLLLVILRSTIADELNAYLKSSILWKNIKILKLYMNKRVQLPNKQPEEYIQQNVWTMVMAKSLLIF